jgi:hypothetical protein
MHPHAAGRKPTKTPCWMRRARVLLTCSDGYPVIAFAASESPISGIFCTFFTVLLEGMRDLARR